MLGMCEESFFGDKRLDRRFLQLLDSMLEKEQVSIGSLSDDWASQMAYYRLLGNKKVNTDKIIKAMFSYTQQVCGKGHYLFIQDTTQPNYEWNRHNIKPDSGLGVIGNRKDLGFFLHPGLIIDASSQACLGFAHVHYWIRSQDAEDKKQRKYNSLPIEKKESYRWLESFDKADQLLSEAD